ncbi:hypothetical protein FOA52_009192 [Chlamydomonas sp. UWO 241]|nr:hypothetical protein FOA52_009192 [Chlamydomonas sp. UWO 241]
MENKLRAAFGCIDGVTRDDIKFIEGNRGGRSVLQVVAREVVDEQLLDRIDTNLDLFAVNNGVFDTASGQMVYRPLEMQDYVMRHAKWDYCPEQAGDKRTEVGEYLAEVLPVEEEREVVLRFFAALMRRREKKFLVLPDKSSGNNGKTTLLSLMAEFFGKYCSFDGNKFACQSSLANGRDSHYAGLEHVSGRGIGPSSGIAPFRSKFVHILTPGAEHEFVTRDITARFASWMSSLAVVLGARFLPNRHFAPLPASMIDWKATPF